MTLVGMIEPAGEWETTASRILGDAPGRQPSRSTPAAPVRARVEIGQIRSRYREIAVRSWGDDFRPASGPQMKARHRQPRIPRALGRETIPQGEPERGRITYLRSHVDSTNAPRASRFLRSGGQTTAKLLPTAKGL